MKNTQTWVNQFFAWLTGHDWWRNSIREHILKSYKFPTWLPCWWQEIAWMTEFKALLISFSLSVWHCDPVLWPNANTKYQSQLHWKECFFLGGSTCTGVYRYGPFAGSREKHTDTDLQVVGPKRYKFPIRVKYWSKKNGLFSRAENQ